MSYAKFLDDWNDEIGRLAKAEDLDTQSISRDTHLALQQQAHKVVFDRWLGDERFGELISYLQSNFDSGQGDEWLYPLSDALLRKKHTRDLKRLWRGVIAMRSKKYWSAKRPPTISEDLSKFGLQSPTFSNDEIATRKKYSLEAMHALESALVALGDVEDAQRLKTEIALFESEKRLPKKKATDKRKIDEVLFWHIIEDCKAASNSSPEYLQNLRSRLEQFSASEIKSFQKRLMQKVEELKSWDLWALAYIVRRGCSNDAFDYFCAWVVAQGRTAFELAKGDIPQFANEVSIEEDLQLEELMYVAEEVYESNTGSPMKSINVAAARIRGKQWEEADLPQRYPDLSALFGFTPPTDA